MAKARLLVFLDVYMACDRYYLDNVKEWFQDDANVSDAEIVIVVPKGSDRVKTPADLIKPGIRVLDWPAGTMHNWSVDAADAGGTGLVRKT